MLGFYISYLAFILIVGIIIGVLLNTFLPEYTTRDGGVISKAFIMLSCLTLSLLILQSKNLNRSVPLLIFALFSTVPAGLGGPALGLLVPTFLTIYGGKEKATKKKRK